MNAICIHNYPCYEKKDALSWIKDILYLYKKEEVKLDWKNSKLLKWAIFFVLFLFGLFCYMKDYGYAEEGGYISSISLDEEMNFFEEGIPVDQEYLFQYPTKCSISMRAEKWVNPYEHKWDNPVLKNNPPNYAQRKEWQDAYDNHHFHAIRTYQDAYNRVWWLPNLTWRQIGRDAWVAACAMASTKTPTSA